MFRISDFSRFTRVSVRMLRHYDRLGILKPAFVDPRSRYRWYSARQLPRLQRILTLRDLGFSLEHVADLLEEDPSGRALRRVLVLRKLEIGREVEEGRRRIAQIEARLAGLDARGDPPPDVVVRRVRPLTVATRRARVADLETGVEELFESLEAEVARAGVRAAAPPILVYHDRDGRCENADVEAAVPVTGPAKGLRAASVRTLPAIELAACTTYVGGYEPWWRIVKGLLATLDARRLAPAGPMREVFVQFHARETRGIPRAYLAERDEDFVTEMQLPVRLLPASARARRRSSARARSRMPAKDGRPAVVRAAGRSRGKV